MKIVRLASSLAAMALVVSSVSMASAEPLKLGNEGNYPPFSVTQADGTLTGLEPELARMLCQRMSMECDIRAYEFGALLPSLITGKIDMIVSQLFPKPERLEKTEFTSAILENPETWIVSKSWAGDVTPGALSGKSIGIIKGAWNVGPIKEYAPDATLKQYDNINAIHLDLDAGRIDIATAGRLSVIRSILDKEGGDKWKLAKSPAHISGDEAYSWAVQKGNIDLRDKVNAALEELFADCTYTNIRKQFFSQPTSTREPASCQ